MTEAKVRFYIKDEGGEGWQNTSFISDNFKDVPLEQKIFPDENPRNRGARLPAKLINFLKTQAEASGLIIPYPFIEHSRPQDPQNPQDPEDPEDLVNLIVVGYNGSQTLILAKPGETVQEVFASNPPIMVEIEHGKE